MDHLTNTFAALADPTRRAMLAQLSKGEANVSDLAGPFLKNMSLPAITKHLKVLEKAGLVTKKREAQRRPCQLNGAPLKDAADWMQQYKKYWEESFDRLEDYLKTLTKKKDARKENAMAGKNKSNEIRITRTYDAPVKLVWDAWTDVKKVANWWGPRGFTITTHSKDFRVGGTWDYTMHSPDGTDYPNSTVYHEIEKYSRLVYDHGGYKDRPPLFRVTVTFEELKGKTKMDMRMKLETPEKAEEMRKFIKDAGGNGTWDRLAEYLEEESSGKHQFVINRTFEASADLMYKMWTDPKHFSKWLAPTGFNMEFIRADIKPGGKSFYCMSNNDFKMYGRAHYLEISPTRLVYTQQFCDEKENISRHPHAPIWPETMLTVVTFNEYEPGLTTVTVTWEPHGKFTPEELEFFIKARGGMTQGWTGSFDKLEAYLPQKLT